MRFQYLKMILVSYQFLFWATFFATDPFVVLIGRITKLSEELVKNNVTKFFRRGSRKCCINARVPPEDLETFEIENNDYQTKGEQRPNQIKFIVSYSIFLTSIFLNSNCIETTSSLLRKITMRHRES